MYKTWRSEKIYRFCWPAIWASQSVSNAIFDEYLHDRESQISGWKDFSFRPIVVHITTERAFALFVQALEVPRENLLSTALLVSS